MGRSITWNQHRPRKKPIRCCNYSGLNQTRRKMRSMGYDEDEDEDEDKKEIKNMD